MNPGNKLLEAVALARLYEKLLVGRAHVALTGSALYGDTWAKPSGKDDIDFVLYPHGTDKKVTEDTIKLLPVTIDKPGSEHKRYERRVYICYDNQTGRRVDFFLFNQ